MSTSFMTPFVRHMFWINFDFIQFTLILFFFHSILLLAQVSFNLSTNTSESSSSNLQINHFKYVKKETASQPPTYNHTVPSELSKAKAILNLKSASSVDLPISQDVHKSASLCSLDLQKQNINKNMTRQKMTLKNPNLETLILVVHGGEF